MKKIEDIKKELNNLYNERANFIKQAEAQLEVYNSSIGKINQEILKKQGQVELLSEMEKHKNKKTI